MRCIRKRLRRVLLKRQYQKREQQDRLGEKELLVLVGVAIALLLLYIAASAWLNSVQHFSLQPRLWGALYCLTAHVVVGSGQKSMVCTDRQHYHPEFEHCLFCGEELRPRRYLNWRKPIQMLRENVYVTSRGRYCLHHPQMTYLSAAATRLSLPHSTYGLDVLVRIGYLRDYKRMTFAQIRESLPAHIRVSERHLSNLYKEYLALLACAERLDVDKLKAAAAKYGGLILSVDGLEPEGGQPQLWVVREVLTGTLIAAGWLPRVDKTMLTEFLTPVKALNLPWLATVSDKQSTLIKALNATWLDLPHQYCQAHYLSNAVTPLYEADEHMKTQMRKQVRKQAGATMRQAQAEAKQRASTDDSSLVVTGLAVHPPAGLEEVKAAAQACRDKAVTPQDTPTLSKPEPVSHPQTAADVRQVLKGSNVIVYECRSKKNPALTNTHTNPAPPPSDSQQQVDELVAEYAARLRRILSRSGRKPFRLAGLRLYADLLTLLGSLETSLTHLPNEPRLACFADAIRDALLAFEAEYTWIAEGYSWVLDISDVLDAPLPEPESDTPDTPLSSTVQAQLAALLERLRQRTDLGDSLLSFRKHVLALTERYAPGLFHCYDIPGLPRTNNDLESLFGRVRRQTLLTSGPYHAKQRLHEQGIWLLFDVLRNEHEQVQSLQHVSLVEWQDERQRMQEHQAVFTNDRRFRRQTPQYLAELETQAVDIARQLRSLSSTGV
jgi:hypothetical protein